MKQPSPAATRSSVLVRGFGARTAIQLRCNNSTRLDLAMSETTSDVRNLRFCAGVVTPCRYNDLRANRPAQNQVCAPVSTCAAQNRKPPIFVVSYLSTNTY